MTQIPNDGLLGSRAVKQLVPVSDMSLWRWVKAGAFPKPIKIQRHNYWKAAEISTWLAEKSAARDAV